MSKKTAKRLGWAAFIVVNVVVLFFTARAEFAGDTPPLALDGPPVARLAYAAGALGCIVAVVGAEAGKYLVMMRHCAERVSLRVALETALLGKYFDAITPSGAGGQPFQIWNLHRRGYSHAASAAMPLASFIAMQYTFIVVAVAALVLGGRDVGVVGITQVAWLGVACYAAVPTLVVIAAVSRKTAGRIVGWFIRVGARLRLLKRPAERAATAEALIGQFAEGLIYIAKARIVLVELAALSLVYHAALYSLPFFVVRALGGGVGFWASLAACIIVYAAVTVVPTPGNAGAAEGSFYLLFSRLGAAGTFWAMLIWRFLSYYLFIVVGLVVLGVGSLLQRRRRAPEQEAKAA